MTLNSKNKLCLTSVFIAPPCNITSSTGDTPNVSIVAFPYKYQVENGVLTIAKDVSLYYINCSRVSEIVVDKNMQSAYDADLNAITFTNAPANIVLKTYLEGQGTAFGEEQYHSWIGTKLPSTATHYVWYHSTWTLYDDWAAQFNQGGGGGGDDAD